MPTIGTDLHSAVEAVKAAATLKDSTAAAAQEAAVAFEAAVTIAKAAHDELTKLVADVVPGLAPPRKREI